MATKRIEEWTKDYEGMTSTVVVDVLDDNTVHVSDELLTEFGIDREGSVEVVDGFARPHFVWKVPYDNVKTALARDGWKKTSADSEE